MIAKFETGGTPSNGTGSAPSGGGSSMNTILLILGLAAVAYIGFRYLNKKKEDEQSTNTKN